MCYAFGIFSSLDIKLDSSGSLAKKLDHLNARSGHMTKRFYKPALDVVRFMAFSAVFLHHILPRGAGNDLMTAIANSLGFGLCLFFCLSSYLITLLLLREKQSTGTINLPWFYLRRMLRIWPLYFAMLFAGTAVMIARHSQHLYGIWFVAAFLLCANFVHPAYPMLSHLWSISVEEQFYTFWPITVRSWNRGVVLNAAIALLIAANLTLIHFGRIHADTDIRIWNNSLVQGEMFASGILLALFEGKIFISASKALSLLSLAIAPIVWIVADKFLGIKGSQVNAMGPVSLCLGYALVAVGCVLIIAGMSHFERWPKALLYLGKISYGLYIFHDPILGLRDYIHFQTNRIAYDLFALVATIGMAALSYRFLESPFLRWKGRLEVIRTRPV